MKFFTKKASRGLATKNGGRDWDRRWAQYEQYLKHIRSRLSPGWRKIASTDLHDAEIFSFGAPRDDEFIINIDMHPMWKQLPFRICSLHLYGMRRIQMPRKALQNPLIHTEVHAPEKGGGEMRALLADRQELRIVPDDVEYFLNYPIGDW